VEYKCYFEGSPQRIGIANLMESLISDIEGDPGMIYAYFP